MTKQGRCPITVCAGSDCARDQRSNFKKLLAELDGSDVVRTKCMGVCHGPVAVVDAAGDRPVVIQRIRSRKQARAVLELATGGGSAPDRLRLVVEKKKRRKAVSRARAALG